MQNDPLLQILILLTASICVVAAVRKLALPAILGYLVVGMLLGPNALALAADTETTRLLADFGIVFLVFTLGLEFSLPRLVAMRGEVLGVGGAQMALTAGIVAAIAAAAYRVAPAVAVVVGGAAAMSSTAIIVAQLTDQSENNRTHGRLAVAICLFQDLAFTLLLALESALRNGGHAGGARAIAVDVGIAALALLLVLAAGRWLLRPLFHAIASFRSPELFSLTVFLVVLASAWATHAAGLSLALGGFLAGMMLAESEFRHQVEATIRSYRDVLLGLFFITIGMLLDTRPACCHIALVTGLVVALVVARPRSSRSRPSPSRRAGFKSIRTGSSSSHRRRIRFRIAHHPAARSTGRPEIVQPLLAAIVLSMVASPLIIRHNKQIARWLLGRAAPRRPPSRVSSRDRARSRSANTYCCAGSGASARTSRAFSSSSASNTSRSTTIPHGCARLARPATPLSTGTRARKRCSRMSGWNTPASS